MTKVRVTRALLTKMDEAFKGSTRTMIARGDGGLTRTELRALERHGWVEKITVSGQRKWTDTTPSMAYRYRMRQRPK